MGCLTNPTEERLVIAVGTSEEIKLLGIPAYKPGTDRKTGDIIAEKTMEQLEQWLCSDSVVDMVFDTTASNTGHLTAACVAIQQSVGRALFWSACRHHVGEVILTHVFKDLKMETSKSPEVTVFSRFRKSFELLPQEPLKVFDESQFTDEAKEFVTGWKTRLIDIANREVDLCRDDYREFMELCLLYLGANRKPITFKRPGALHKARWMSKLLYALKICLLEDEISDLPAGTITTKAQVPKIREFVNFATLIYSTWWITSRSAVDAPWHDLQLYKDLLNYESVNSVVSNSAIQALKRHLWYLNAEMVTLALFSTIVPSDQRRALADKMLELKPEDNETLPSGRYGSGFGKPVFPGDITMDTTLADFASKDSWYMMRTLDISDEFMRDDVVAWDGSDSYKSSLENIKAMNVVNDCAERGVKLGSDFLSSAKSETHYQNVLHVVEQDRTNLPNLRKRKID